MRVKSVSQWIGGALLGVAAASAFAAAPAKAPPEKPIVEADAEQLVVADRVIYGQYECEFSQKLWINRDAAHPGYVELKYKSQRWIMKPVQSPSGAIRMEDVQGTTLVLQIAHKSMLMDTRSGQRLVDACRVPPEAPPAP